MPKKTQTELTAQRLTKKLMRAPRKDKGDNRTYYYNTVKNAVHQADLLYLPNDKGFKYALVVVDISTKAVDMIPLRTKTANAIKNGFVKVYNGKYLEFPKRIELDPGTEFKSVVKNYFENNNVKVKYGKTGRHRNQAIVERMNQTIGDAIAQVQIEKEIQMGKVSRLWIHLVKPILNYLNAHTKKTKEKYVSPSCEGNSCNVLQQNTQVLAPLDEPRDIEGKKLHGKFRSADIKYDTKIRTIQEIILRPNSPVMYILNGDNTPYTKNQLLVLENDEVHLLKKLVKS